MLVRGAGMQVGAGECWFICSECWFEGGFSCTYSWPKIGWNAGRASLKRRSLQLDTRASLALPDILALQDLPEHRWVQSLASPLRKKKGKPARLGQAPVRRSPERIKILKAPAGV